jgi:hypothetical protein
MRRAALPLLAAVLGSSIAFRTVVAWAPALRFDVDPAFDPAPFAGLGPCASLGLDAVIAASAALILARGASRWSLALLLAAAMASFSVFVAHAPASDGAPWRGATWLAAFAAAAAAAALARSVRPSDRTAWSVLVAILLGVAGAWWARGAWQWFVEHPEMVEYFRSRGRDLAFFADRGWEPDGPQAAAYVRRLTQREMTGWFGLANIFAGVCAAVAVAMTALGARLAGRDRIVAGAAAALCAAVPVANGSKGAVVSLALGLAGLAVVRRARARPAVLAAGALSLLALCAFAAPLRALWPADAFGQERSLLFRSHYIAGAWRVFLDQPWIGSGIDRFQDAFLRVRPPDAVDAVQSAHAVFFDWLAQLGAAGVPLAMIVLAMLASAVAAGGRAAAPATDDSPRPVRGFCALGLFAAALLATRCEAHTLDPPALAARMAGALLAGALGWWLQPRLARWSAAPAAILGVAALTVWIDGQIEMTLWHPGSVAWGCALLAAALPRRAESARRPFECAARWLPAAACAALALACARFAVIAGAEEDRFELAARRLVDAAQAAAPWGGEPGSAARVACADILLQRDDGGEPTDAARAAAIEQLMRAATLEQPAAPPSPLLRRAAVLSERTGGRTVAQRQTAALLLEQIARQSGSPADAQAALDAALRITEWDARRASAWLRAARWASRLGDAAAASYARRAIEADDSMAFDILLKMSAADRREAEFLAATAPRP